MCVCMRACVCMCAFAFVWHWWYVISIMEVFDAISQQHFKQSENTFATTTTVAAHTRRTHQFISALWLDIFILEISIPFVHLYTSLRICINYISTVVLCMEYKHIFAHFMPGKSFFLVCAASITVADFFSLLLFPLALFLLHLTFNSYAKPTDYTQFLNNTNKYLSPGFFLLAV